MDDDNLDRTSTNHNFSTHTNSVPVIANDQSFQQLDDRVNESLRPDEHELDAHSSEYHSMSPESTLAPSDEAHCCESTNPTKETTASDEAYCCEKNTNPAKETTASDEAYCCEKSTNPTKETTASDEVYCCEKSTNPTTTASESLSCDAALCDRNVDTASTEVLLAHDQTSNDDSSRLTFNNDISPENDQIDPPNQINDHLPAFSNCTNFDKSNYSVEFMENLSKIEKNDSLIAADLISSETMNDFFDEMYDVNYPNHCKKKVDESNNVVQNDYRVNLIDNNLKDQDWSASALESDLCNLSANPSADNASLRSSLKKASETDLSTDYLPCKKARRGITFDSVSVYYFPRTQGFTCVPSQGGSTLGMSWNHTHIRKFSLGEHAAEQRKAHRQLCSQQLDSSTNWNELSNISSEDSDSDEIVSDSEVDYENYNFLQPIPTRDRRAMLRAAGIHKIDSREKDECRTIRLSREFCGCTCQIYCDPERCVCAQAGIKCQVDRMNFPCSCTRDGCANENGRIEFNPMRVRTHFIHTLMRLDMEKKKEEEEEHNHRLLFGDLDNSVQLAPYSTSALAQSSSVGGAANLLTTFTYHPESLPFYNAQQPSHQSSLYDVSPAPPSESAQLPNFGYEGHQYAMAADDSSYSSQLTSVSNLTVLGENSSSSLATAGYAIDYSAESEPTGFHSMAEAASASRATYRGMEPFFVDDDEAAKERSLECQSEGETLDTSAEVSEETEKEEESDVENFGDIIKKTMVESVIA